jgi:hypothetical protein
MKQKTGPVALIPFLGHMALVNAIYWLIRSENWWRFLGFVPMNPSFADLRAYTAQVSCSEAGIEYLEDNCDPWGREIGLLNVYIPIMRFFGFDESRTELLGNSFQVLLFIAIYILAYALRINLKSLKHAFLMLLAMVSPPMAIAIERGQFEIVLLVFTILSCFLIYRNKQHIAYIVLGILSILKMYSIVALVLLLVNRSIKNSKRDLWFGFSVLLVSTGIILYGIGSQQGGSPSSSLSEGFWRTFGVTVSPYLIVKLLKDLQILDVNFEFSLVLAHLTGMFICLVVVIVLAYLRQRKKTFGPDLSRVISENSLGSRVVQVSLMMIFVTFFVVSSYDYRMIYLIPLFIVGLAQDKESNKDGLTKYLVYGTILAMWAQAFIWTSAIAQLPILVTILAILFNIGPTLRLQYPNPFKLPKMRV